MKKTNNSLEKFREKVLTPLSGACLLISLAVLIMDGFTNIQLISYLLYSMLGLDVIIWIVDYCTKGDER